MSVDVELSSLPARINLYLNSVNRTLGNTASSFEMSMASSLITADTNEFFFKMLYNLMHLIIFIKYKSDIIQIFKLY